MIVLTRLKGFLRYAFTQLPTGLRTRWQAGWRKRGGFNTLDITVAMAITAALASVVVPSIKSSVDNARANSLIQEIDSIHNVLIRFYADTNQMPIIVGTSDVTDINGNQNPRGTSGLRFNGKPIIGWNGPYLGKDVGNNPFGGNYRLEYTQVVPIDVTDLKTGQKITNRASAVMMVTGLPPGVADKVDTTMDDGNSDKGVIRTKKLFDAVTGDIMDEVLEVVVLPGVRIDPDTGTVF